MAYRIRDAQGVAWGGAVQLRAETAAAAGVAARELRGDAVTFEIVAVVAL